LGIPTEGFVVNAEPSRVLVPPGLLLPESCRRIPRILLDTHQPSYLLGHGPLPKNKALEARSKLHKAVESGVLEVLVLHDVLEEVTGLACNKSELYSAVIDELRILGNGRIVRRTKDRLKLEIRLGRELRLCELFIDTSTTQGIWDSLADAEHASRVSARVTRRVARFEREEKDRREKSRSQMAAAGLKKVDIKRWFDAHPQNVDDWARDLMRDEIASLPGLPRIPGPSPSDLPTVSRFMSYRLGRIFFNNFEGRAIRSSDFYDGLISSGIGYASTFVTDDGALRETLEGVSKQSSTPLESRSLEDFLWDLP
jgi:hypothetical protein